MCCREQGLALPSGRDLRKIFRKEGDVYPRFTVGKLEPTEGRGLSEVTQ